MRQETFSPSLAIAAGNATMEAQSAVGGKALAAKQMIRHWQKQ